MKNAHLSANSTLGALAILASSLFLLISMLPTQALGDDVDPASRVARISYLQGSVSMQIGNSDEWAQARINRPLTSSDQVWTDTGSRAELQIGMATIHLDQNTQLGLMELSDNVLQVQLNQGVLNLTVRGMDNADTIEIDTPNSSITIPEPGSYRVEVSDNDDLTIVQVRNGSANVAGERQQYSVRENEQLRLRGSDRLNAQFDDLDRMDEFDQWVAARNSRASDATAAQYVDGDVVGYEDLDDYGNWRWEAGYGNVWYPSQVVSSWSPYRFGHWDWISPWGWTWVDDAPWGFAPFHYGRWAQVHDHWCWVPGSREVRAVYAPALVAWVGTPGASISVNVNGGSVGWIPLGPHEVYRPQYGASAAYLARVNISNSLLNRDEYERQYQSRDVIFVNRGAASVVAAAAFTSAANVRRNLLPVDRKQLSPIETLRNLRPDRPAVLGNARAIAAPVQLINREVMAQRKPAPFIPHPELSASHNVTVGGAVRVIEPVSSRSSTVGNERNETRPERNFTPPVERDNSNHNAQMDDRRFDRWGRGNDRMENQQNQQNDIPNDQQRRFNPPQEHHETTDQETNQRQLSPSPPQQNQQQQPRRIGPWIHDEQRLRPEPQPQQQHQNQPPVNPAPAPRAEPPRSSTPPPPARQNNPPNNQHEDHPNSPNNRKEIQ